MVQKNGLQLAIRTSGPLLLSNVIRKYNTKYLETNRGDHLVFSSIFGPYKLLGSVHQAKHAVKGKIVVKIIHLYNNAMIDSFVVSGIPKFKMECLSLCF